MNGRVDPVRRQAALDLIQAITSRDRPRLSMLIEQGADPHCLVPENARAITPTAFALRAGRVDLLPLLLGQKQKSVPAGIVDVNGEERDLWGAFGLWAQDAPLSIQPTTVHSLTSCFDLRSPEVNHSMWRSAATAAGCLPDREISQGHRDFVVSVLEHGGYPVDPEEYVKLLATKVSQQLAVTCRLLDDLCAADGSILARFLTHGMSPNLVIGGMPLLHWAVGAEDAVMAADLMEAGANLDAAVPFEVIRREILSDAGAMTPGQKYTAVEMAFHLNFLPNAQAIEAFRAKRRVDAVLASARGQTPSKIGAGA